MRICGQYAFKQFIKSKYITVEYLLLSVCFKKRASHLGKTSVEIPFDICYICAVHYLFYAIKKVISNILTTHIKYILMPRYAHISVWSLQCPFGMFSEKLAIFWYHFRLKPNTKFKSESVYSLCQRSKSAFELFLIDEPIAKRGPWGISVAKPTVIHYKHFNAKLGCGLCYIVDLFLVKVKVCSFPVVDQNGTAFVFPFTAAKIVSVKLMEYTAHTAKSFIGIHHYSFGRFKALVGFKVPHKSLGINAHKNSRSAVGIHLCGSIEVSRIYEIKAVSITTCFGSIVRTKRYKRIVRVRRASSFAFGRLSAM